MESRQQAGLGSRAEGAIEVLEQLSHKSYLCLEVRLGRREPVQARRQAGGLREKKGRGSSISGTDLWLLRSVPCLS